MSEKLAKASPDIVARTVSGETLLVPVRGDVAECDNIFILNQTGSFLWSHLDGTQTVAQLANLLTEAFDGTSAESARSDVTDFLAAINTRKLIGWEQSRE